MRKFALLAALVAVACFGVVGVSSAINGKAGLKIKVTPSAKGTKAKPKNITLFTDITTTPAADDQPFATKTTVVHLDKNLVFNGASMKSCTQAQVQQGGCSSSAKLGTGKATGVALGQTENLTVTAFNGPGGNKLELHVVGNAPLVIDSVIEGVLQTDSGAFGKKLSVTIPDNLQQPLTGVFATLTDFQVTLHGKGSAKKPYYIGLKGCTGGKVSMKVDLTYTDGTTQSATSTSPCH